MGTILGENKSKILMVSSLIFLAGITRLFPHIDNFTPIGAMALFGGTYIANRNQAFLIPMGAMLFSDILLQLLTGNGFHNTMIFVYGAFALITSIGFILQKRVQRQTIMVASLISSLIFFFVTNFGVWVTGYYGYSSAGLLTCFIEAIPFFRGTIMGDLFFNLVLFGSFSLLKWKYPAFSK